MPQTFSRSVSGHHILPSKFGPSDLDNASEDSNSISSRQGRGRRDSILGIRNIFSRSSKKEGESAILARASRSSSIRASFSEKGHWPYGPQARSDALASAQSLCDSAHEGPDVSHRLPLPHHSVRRKPSTGTIWTAPPLSKAYSQAVMHGVLPSPTLSADAILRTHEKKNPASAEAVPLDDLAGAGEFQVSEIDRLKRRLRGDALAAYNLQWTAKIYILVLSGYLLQYSGEGHHDRLPEKVLHLGPSSAAFASDLIPGRHWVLQVSSATDNEGACQTEPRSLLSKLHLRIPDRRTTSNLLMVFEGAEDMKEWIAILRTQIEKSSNGDDLIESGMMTRDSEAELVSRGQSFRHPFRKGSTSGLRNRTAAEDVELEPRATNSPNTAADVDGALQDSLVDDASITTSIKSQDGRQLDSLRENSNRFSYLSSGQRTVMTSTCSSPAASPVVDRFPRPPDGDCDGYGYGYGFPSRRPSLHSPLAEDRRKTSSEYSPASHASPQNRSDAPSRASPNRVASSRRTSYGGKLPPTDYETTSSGPKVGLSLFPRPSLRKPLGTIRVSRPLSIVEDQPSPRDYLVERPVTSHHAGSRPSTPPFVPLLPPSRFKSISQAASFDTSLSQSMGRCPSLMTGKPTLAVPADSRPRRLSSLGALRKQTETCAAPRKEASRPPLAIRMRPSFSSQCRKSSSHVRRLSDEGSEAAQIHAALSRAAKRASIASISSKRSSNGELTFSIELPPLPAPPPSKALPPIPQRPLTACRARLTRKSSMHGVEGPPPAPPPTCALPPIPRK